MNQRELIDDIQAEISDLIESAETLRQHLVDAQTCETAEDLIQNLEDAAKVARGIMTGCKGAALPELAQLKKLIQK